MSRSPTAVDLSAFAPDQCEYGHWTRGRGRRMVSYAPCDCAGVREDERGRLGHIQVKCTACERAGRRTVFYDPPHLENG